MCPASLSSHEILQYFTGAVTNKVQVKVAIVLPHASALKGRWQLQNFTFLIPTDRQVACILLVEFSRYCRTPRMFLEDQEEVMRKLQLKTNAVWVCLPWCQSGAGAVYTERGNFTHCKHTTFILHTNYMEMVQMAELNFVNG